MVKGSQNTPTSPEMRRLNKQLKTNEKEYTALLKELPAKGTNSEDYNEVKAKIKEKCSQIKNSRQRRDPPKIRS